MVFKYLIMECREDRARLMPALGKGAKIPSYNTNSEKILQKILFRVGRYWNRLSKKVKESSFSVFINSQYSMA